MDYLTLTDSASKIAHRIGFYGTMTRPVWPSRRIREKERYISHG